MVKSADDLNEQKRESDVLISAIEKCEKLEKENQQLKELLWACQDELYSHLDSGAEAMADAITNAIGEKNNGN